MTVSIAPISPKNIWQFKTVRLRALEESPTAFGSTHAQESRLSDQDWHSRAIQCASGPSIGYLAIGSNRPYGIIRGTPDDQDPLAAWVESMWVDPSVRRLGIGRQLVEAIFEWARDRRFRVLKLAVTCNNEPAIAFYTSLGFSPTGRTMPYPNDQALVECEMSKTLS